MKKYKRYISRIVSWVLTALFAIIFVLIGYMLVCNINHKVPQVFGYSIMRIKSGSMEPTYEVNSYIMVRKTDISKLKVGDVITFYSSDKDIYMMPNTHRIMEIKLSADNRLTFITKGDNNEMRDSNPVYQDNIIGKVVGKLGFLQAINFILQNQILFFVVIIIPVAGIMTYEIIKIVKMKSSEEDE